MTIHEIIDELQSIEYQLDGGHINDAQSNLNLLKDNLEKEVIVENIITYEEIQIDGC